MDEICLSIDGTRRAPRIELSLLHLQIDDLSHNAEYPVLLEPSDSGFNSLRHKRWVDTIEDRERWERHHQRRDTATAPSLVAPPPRPKLKHWLRLQVEFIPSDQGFRALAIDVGSITLAAHLDSLLAIGEDFQRVFVAGGAAPGKAAVRRQVQQDASDVENVTQLACALFVAPQPTEAELAEASAGALYFHRLRVGSFSLVVVVDANPEKAGAGGGLTALVGPTVGAILGTFASLNIKLSFSDVVFHMIFAPVAQVIQSTVWMYVTEALAQLLKVLGSLQIFGDPAELFANYSFALKEGAHQTSRGHPGRGSKLFLQGAVGGSLGALAKAANAGGDILRTISGLDDQEEEAIATHVGTGLALGTTVFVKNIFAGLSGFVTRPFRGARDGGVKGLLPVVIRGKLCSIEYCAFSQLWPGFSLLRSASRSHARGGSVKAFTGGFASPFVGLLGFIEKGCEGMKNTTHLGDRKVVPVKYFARTLFYNNSVAALHALVLILLRSALPFHVRKATRRPPRHLARHPSPEEQRKIPWLLRNIAATTSAAIRGSDSAALHPALKSLRDAPGASVIEIRVAAGRNLLPQTARGADGGSSSSAGFFVTVELVHPLTGKPMLRQKLTTPLRRCAASVAFNDNVARPGVSGGSDDAADFANAKLHACACTFDLQSTFFRQDLRGNFCARAHTGGVLVLRLCRRSRTTRTRVLGGCVLTPRDVVRDFACRDRVPFSGVEVGDAGDTEHVVRNSALRSLLCRQRAPSVAHGAVEGSLQRPSQLLVEGGAAASTASADAASSEAARNAAFLAHHFAPPGVDPSPHAEVATVGKIGKWGWYPLHPRDGVDELPPQAALLVAGAYHTYRPYFLC